MRVALTLEQCWHRVPGGTAVAALGLARALMARPDVTPVAITARHREPPPQPWALPDGMEQHALALSRRVMYLAWQHIGWPDVDHRVEPFDVVHATTIIVPPRPRHTPLVATVHDLAFRHEPGQFTRAGARLFERGLAMIRAHADLVLCSSEATLADCVDAGLGPDRLRVVPLGTDVSPASPDAVAAARSTYHLDPPYVLWNGTIEPRKNLPALLAAYRAVAAGHEHHLVLAGPAGWGTDLDQLIASAGLDGLRSRVHVVGFVPTSDLAALMAGASVFVYPSLREGFGLPVLEAMVQGTPVVTSRGTSTEEVAGQAGLLVDPHDVDAIAAAIVSVLDQPEVAGRLAAAGRARADDFTWARTAEATVEQYRQVVG